MIDIKVDTENQKDTRLAMTGTGTIIMSELAFAINRMYCAFCRHGENGGEEFRRTMTALVTDEDSPLWLRVNIPEEVAVSIAKKAEKNPGQEANS